MTTDLRYPIGKFSHSVDISPQERASPVEAIAELPQKMRDAVRGLSEVQIDTVSHPANGRQTLEQIAMLYAWHGQYHAAQITALRQRMGW